MSNEAPTKQPLIFEYEDYRVFLRDTYSFQKARSRHFSFRNFSRRAGFSSPNFLKLVIEGQRNLSASSVEKFIAGLRLNKSEGEFFHHLVRFTQARNPSERAECARHILQSKGFQKIYPLKQAEYSYYACWYYIPVRELVSLVDFQENPHWVAKNVFPAITINEASQALRDLETLGLLCRTNSGKLVQAQKTVTTANEVTSSSVANYHREMLQKAADSIDTVPRTQREISAACIPVSKATATKIKSMLQEFRHEILTLAAQDDSPEAIYQVNMQLFPISAWQEENEEAKE
jgi:uncharacterized protein (TIGR02147 family)